MARIRCFDSKSIAKLDPKYSSQGWYGEGAQKSAKDLRSQGDAGSGMTKIKGAVQAASVPDKSKTQVDLSGADAEANANRGRAALIATSASGVLGTEGVGRRRLLGN